MFDLIKMLQGYENNKIAIYGLSVETEKVLSEIGDKLSIIGLLDGYRVDGTLYGKDIITLNEAIAREVSLILVVARPGSCKAIAKRIGKICIENQIVLLDIRGNDLCNVQKVFYDFNTISGFTKKQLQKRIDDYEVLSIDLFDTLIMRQILFPSDVFELVDDKLRTQGVYIENFSGKRLDSEKYLSQFHAPTLKEIYDHMIVTHSIKDIFPDIMAEIEWSIDYELIVPRYDMCALLNNLLVLKKEVYIVSDTFYTKKQILKILEKCNINLCTGVILSCEYRTGKKQNLFRELKRILTGKSCLHIGDDIVADKESAESNNISAFKIYSGMELLGMLGYLGLWNYLDTISDRIRIGIFITKIFNSPFQFESNDNKINVNNAKDIGFLFFAPMIIDFVIWFHNQVEIYALENIWFCSRDGYLIKKLYDEFVGDDSSIYFLTSRTAAIRAGVRNDDDICSVEQMKYSGTLKEQLKDRFGILVEEETDNGSILAYKNDILKKATASKRNYQTYINKLDIKDGTVAFFDFVAKGTSQMYLGNLIKNHLKGLYFLQLEEENMIEKGLDIVSFYETKERDKSAIFDNYYILETILTSQDASILEFDESGTPCYANDTRKAEDLKTFQSVQDGIVEYFRIYLKICPRKEYIINKKLDEKLLMLIHQIHISDKNFMELKVEDSFFNRMTDIIDLI